ncbi:XRE family transcriptional regulator [Actinomycetales bacterium SN12]|nr:XRE family transcriptional regulator [Actinomycetales bacterium SN12]
MSTTRIGDLRHARGWTQERLASESGVGLRTVQRLEAGSEGSLETLSLVAGALRVSVGELFANIDDAEFGDRVEALDSRAREQQSARDRTVTAWRWLYIGIGVVLTVFSFTMGPAGLVLFLAYWSGGLLILIALGRIILEPRLDARFPLSRSKRQLRDQRRAPLAKTTGDVEQVS